MIILDCTELYVNPVRTGIQRVVRELLRCWPTDAPEARPARFAAGVGLVSLSSRAVRLLTEEEPGSDKLSYADVVGKLSQIALETGAEILQGGLVFIPEVFYDPARCAFYQEMIAAQKGAVALLAYDFLPFLRPEMFRLRTALPLMHYLRLVRSLSHVGHISDQTRADYCERISRNQPRATGPVLPLGADGLKLERQSWSRGRRTFVALGSLDGRKNQHLIVEAFIQLWEAGHNIPLTLVGRAFENLDLDWLAEADRYPAFRWLDAATDDDVAKVLRTARATIYVSEMEGFGLPPVESLAVGIPAIVARAIPSIVMLPRAGQVRLDAVASGAIADAVLHLMNDGSAAELWSEAAELRMPSWKAFAAKTAEWLLEVRASE